MIAQVYLGLDVCAMLNLEAKIKIRNVLSTNLRTAREQLCHDIINILGHYRKNVSVSSSPSQFVLPETMKIYPVMLLGLLKTPAFALIEDVKLDHKVASLSQLSYASVNTFWNRVYPRVFSVSAIINPENQYGTLISNPADGVVSNLIIKPNNMPSSVEKMQNTDAYLITNSDYIYVYLPDNVKDEIIQQVN
jgi:protein transport protein SEC24